MTDGFGVVTAVRRTACCGAKWRAFQAEGLLDLVVDDVRVPVDAVGVDGLRDADAVPRAGGDLSGRAAGIKPQ